MKTAKELLKLFEAEEAETFLPATLVMIDLEMTGVIPTRDQILQIAMIKLEREGNGYKEVGEPLEIFMAADVEPENDFQREFLADIMKKCQASDVSRADAKIMIEEWLGDWRGIVMPTGDAIQCDMMFLYFHKVCEFGDIGDDGPKPGTFNYECFDLNPIKLIAREKRGGREKIDADPGHHNALVDCRNQLLELNASLETLLEDKGSEIE